MGTPLPLPKRGRSSPLQFSAHFYCGHTAGCIKMLLGTEVGFIPGDPAPLPKKGGGALSPIFGPCLLRPNGWMDQDDTYYGGRPWPRRHCVRWFDNRLYRVNGVLVAKCIRSPIHRVIFKKIHYYCIVISHYYNAPHCKRCTSYGNSVRLSGTRRYCVKTTARSTVQFALSDSKMCVVFYTPKIFPRDDPFPPLKSGST